MFHQFWIEETSKPNSQSSWPGMTDLHRQTEKNLQSALKVRSSKMDTGRTIGHQLDLMMEVRPHHPPSTAKSDFCLSHDKQLSTPTVGQRKLVGSCFCKSCRPNISEASKTCVPMCCFTNALRPHSLDFLLSLTLTSTSSAFFLPFILTVWLQRSCVFSIWCSEGSEDTTSHFLLSVTGLQCILLFIPHTLFKILLSEIRNTYCLSNVMWSFPPKYIQNMFP